VPSAKAASRPSLWLSTPWVAILFITATFHFYRGVPVDGFIFLAGALALAADTAVRHRSPADNTGPSTGPSTDPGPTPPGAPHHRHSGGTRSVRLVPRWAWLAAAAAAAVLVTAVVVVAPQDSVGIPAVVGLVGSAMLLLTWPQPPHPLGRAAPRVRRAAWWWAGVVLLLCVWELGTYFIDRFAPADAAVFPPLTDLLQPLFNDDSSRWAMTGMWLVACGALVRVVRRA